MRKAMNIYYIRGESGSLSRAKCPPNVYPLLYGRPVAGFRTYDSARSAMRRLKAMGWTTDLHIVRIEVPAGE